MVVFSSFQKVWDDRFEHENKQCVPCAEAYSSFVARFESRLLFRVQPSYLSFKSGADRLMFAVFFECKKRLVLKSGNKHWTPF